ncbi:MAG: hypothetical protein K6F73_08840 [Lachnospiraceae bacterium]|nr:hypothetical protein [Lachnospiraceae bacterium]
MQNTMFLSDIRRALAPVNRDDLNSPWQSEDAGLGRWEITGRYLRRITSLMIESGSYLDTLYDIACGTADGWPDSQQGGLGEMINTFPFGEYTDEIYPEFLGICAGKNPLKQVLAKAVRHAEKALKKYGEACVTILTDKWDPASFAMYETRFLATAMSGKVTVCIFLVTDYGMTHIPFLSDRRVDFLKRNFDGVRIDNQLPAAARKDFTRAVLIGSAYGSLDGSANCGDGKYIFTFRDNRAYFEGSDGDTFRRYKLDETYADRFLIAVDRVIDNGGIMPGTATGERHEMKVFSGDVCVSDRIVWYSNDEKDADPVNADFHRALTNLLGTMKMQKDTR